MSDRNSEPANIWLYEKSPIAIVGMGCRWSGDVRDTHALWELLRNQRSGYREFGDHRFDISGFYSPQQNRPGTISTKGGCLLAEDPRLFDHGFFSIPASEVETMDPSQRKILEVVYEAFENAGVPWDKFSGSQTGVYVGNYATDHTVIQGRDEYTPPYTGTGTALAILSNRVSYALNLKGPSVTLDTACSSGMYALHLAITAIRNGDCDSAIVAGCNSIMDPSVQIALQNLGVLSPTSTSHTFDASADGYCRGEGFAALYLTKISTAMEEGLPIRAVIRGTAVNANGKTGGIMRPSETGQSSVIRKAYENAGNLPMGDTTYLECHGTGTPVGDPIELDAIGATMTPNQVNNPLLVGSVKTNLGHTEAASGIASIMKVVLSMENNLIPPTIGFKKLNPNIDLRGGAIKILTEPTPWPEGRHRRAGINNFGFGGANSHCIIDDVHHVIPNYIKPGIFRGIENAVCRTTNRHGTDTQYGGQNNGLSHDITLERNADHTTISKDSGDDSHSVRLIQKGDCNTHGLVVLPFSAHHETSLGLNIKSTQSCLDRCSLADLAFTLSRRRSRFFRRTFRIVSREDPKGGFNVVEKVFTSPSAVTNLAFVFTGQGAQWPRMGAELFQYEIFKLSISRLDEVLLQLSTPPSWTLFAALTCRSGEIQINDPEISQTVCTAVQIALVDLLCSWNVHPSAVVGHSSGEIATAYAAGRITAAEAIITAYIRGRAVASNTQEGAMLAVGLGASEVTGHFQGLEEQVKVAAINSPQSVTLSGNPGAIEQISQALDGLGIFNRKLQTGQNAYHSHHMLSIGKVYEEDLAVALQQFSSTSHTDFKVKPRVPWVSSVYPHKDISNVPIDASYWRANLESPVQFSSAVSNLLQFKGITVSALVEIGPHSALKGPLQQIITTGISSLPYVSCLKRDQDSQASILRMAGALFCLNSTIDLARVNAEDCLEEEQLYHAVGCMTPELPPYQYTYGPVIYTESTLSKEFRGRKILRHDLLGSKVPGTSKIGPQWRNILRMKDLPWLSDHKLLPHIIFPATGFLATAMAAAEEYYNELSDPREIMGISLRNVDFSTALRIPDDGSGVEIITSMESDEGRSADSPSWIKFSISSLDRDTGTTTLHCFGFSKVELGDKAVGVLGKMSIDMDVRNADKGAWYRRFKKLGFEYGPTFQGMSNIKADPAQSLAVARLDLNTTSQEHQSPYPIHPASLDALLQTGVIAWTGGQPTKATCAYVPVYIDRAYVRFGNTETSGTAIAKGEQLGLRSGYARLQLHNQAGDVVVDIDRLRCVSHNDVKMDGEYGESFSNPFWRLVWTPDIRHMTKSQIRDHFPRLQANLDQVGLLSMYGRLVTMMMTEISSDMPGQAPVPNGPESIQRFIIWIKRRVDENNTWTREARQLRSAQRVKIIEKLVGEYRQNPEVAVFKKLFDHARDILLQNTTGIDLLSKGGLLEDMDRCGVISTAVHTRLSQYFGSLGHLDPNLSILEVGAGTGTVSEVVLHALSSSNRIRRYKDYTVTDVSNHALSQAKDRLINYSPYLEFASLDIEKDPAEQQFTRTYDVIIAAQCLHTTHSVALALKNCHRLLKAGGKLVLVETINPTIGHQFVLGTLPGYWNGVEDGRVDDPFLRLEDWEAKFAGAGFSGANVLLEDFPAPHTITCVMATTAIKPMPHNRTNSMNSSTAQISLLYGSSKSALVDMVIHELKKRGVPYNGTIIDCVTDSTFKPACRVISFLEAEDFSLDVTEKRLQAVQSLFRNASTLVWVTSSGLLKAKKPEGAIITGMLRTLGTELPTSSLLSIDYDPDGSVQYVNLANVIVDREAELQHQAPSDCEDRDYIWQDGCLWVSRLVPDVYLHDEAILSEMPASRAVLSPFDGQGPVRADFEIPGILSSLFFKPFEDMHKPLPQGWIQVKLAATGLNWKDIAVCSGRVDQKGLSCEYSGVVEQVGSAINHLSVGDKVFGFGIGHLGNVLRAPGLWARRLGPDADLVQMASMPLVYMTTLYAFEHLAQIKKGDRVMIQAATGGLGLASIRFAQAMGAEVYATVSASYKVKYLVEVMGMDVGRIFPSRSQVDVSSLTEATGGRGFNIILGTAQGDLMHEYIRTMAPSGRYIDVGRVDVQNSKQIALELFKKSVSFCSFDLGVILNAYPSMGQTLMESLESHLQAGRIGPIPHVTTFDVSELDKALLQFSKGTHIGKLVVTYNEPTCRVRMVPAAPRARFRPDKQSIIVGGLGGLGRSIVSWMADQGCQHFTILSRSGAQSVDASRLITTLASRGIKIHSVQCDVGNAAQVSEVFTDITSIRPIQGIVHSAVSYQDLSFNKLTAGQWNLGLEAKVKGTKNLHDATKDMDLEFFVMITSTEPYLGLATQSAYTAANNFQEAFARYRRSQGLPASTGAFGFVSDLGHLSTNAVTASLGLRNKLQTLTEHQFLKLLKPAFYQGSMKADTNIWHGKTVDPLSAAGYVTSFDPAILTADEEGCQENNDLRPRWYSDARISHVIRALQDAKRDDPELRSNDEGCVDRSGAGRLKEQFQKALASEEGPTTAETLATTAIAKTVSQMVFIDLAQVSTTHSVVHYGVDSLIAAELRHWLRMAFGSDISMLELLDTKKTIENIARDIVRKAVQ